jgi:hypothetical protein
MLGELDLLPLRNIAGRGQIWDRPVVTTSNTELAFVIFAYQPVAHVMSRIPTKSIQSLRNSQWTPKFATGFVHGRDCLRIGQIRQAQSTLLALRVFEIERLPAILAFE